MPAVLEQKTVSKIETNEERVLNQQFDPYKKYVFELVEQNMKRELPVIDVLGKREAPHHKFKPYQNLVYTSGVIWNGQRRMLRYYDGCPSIFADEQPKDKDTIDQLIAQTQRRGFNNGKLYVFGVDRMLLLYLNICSWNAESEFRTPNSHQIFLPQNADKVATLESEILDKVELALGYAREASPVKMKMHCNYLEIADHDWDSGNALTEKELRTAYRTYASKNPDEFIRSYGDKDIELRFFIGKAWDDGIISNKGNANKVTWKGKQEPILDISGMKSREGITQALYEFAKSELGEEFTLQLKAIMEPKV